MGKLTILAVLLVIALCGCSSDSSGGSAGVTVSMENSARWADTLITPANFGAGSAGFLRSTATPSMFKIKLKSIYLVQDISGASEDTGWNGDNSGDAAFIWAESTCATSSASSAGLLFSAIDSDADCSSTISFLDLNRTSSLVNADLNSQQASIMPGTYKYIRMSLLGEQTSGNNTYSNTTWASTGVADQTFASIVTEITAPFSTPLTVADGDTVTLTLAYTLADIVTTGLSSAEEKQAGGGVNQPGRYDDCTAAATTCLNLPELAVTAQ